MNAKPDGQDRRRPGATSPLRLWHPDVPGALWDGTRRVRRNQIAAYCRVLGREFHPQKIIRFGSYACGKSTKDSAVDLLLWKPERIKRTDLFTRDVLARCKVMYET